jgi:hypothetical protein
MFIIELWYEVRPYALLILKDLIVSSLLRVGVWFFHFIGHLMPLWNFYRFVCLGYLAVM